jgi:hypothetical protein
MGQGGGGENSVGGSSPSIETSEKLEISSAIDREALVFAGVEVFSGFGTVAGGFGRLVFEAGKCLFLYFS